MKTRNVTIQYHDFHPSEGSKDFVQNVVNNMMNELPNGSTIKATFYLKDKLIKGMFQVRSYGGPFFSVAVGEDMQVLTVKLLSQMRRRIEKFKSRQHARAGLKNLTRAQKFEEYELTANAAG